MPFEFTSRVRYSETDPEEKLTLVSLVDYFQDASTFQSEDCGVGTRFLKKQDLAWMILSWQIEILRRPYLAEPITAQTWPYDFTATGIMRWWIPGKIISQKQTVYGH